MTFLLKAVKVFQMYLCLLITGSCPSNWKPYNGFCYRVYTTIKSFNDAQTYCHGQGGSLVKIGSNQENDFVLALVRKTDSSLDEYWIGLKWDSSVSKYFWRDDSLMVYSNWIPSEPPSDKNRYPCIVAATKNLSNTSWREVSGGWSGRECGLLQNIKTGFVCEKVM